MSRCRCAVSSNASYARHHPRAPPLRLAQITRNLILFGANRGPKASEREREKAEGRAGGAGQLLFDRRSVLFKAFWLYCRDGFFSRSRQIDNYCLMNSWVFTRLQPQGSIKPSKQQRYHMPQSTQRAHANPNNVITAFTS